MEANFSTLTLVKAHSRGWLDELPSSEWRVLEFIAVWGKRTEPDAAFAWFAQSQEEWAERLGMTHMRLRHALLGLRDRKLVVTRQGSRNDARFRRWKGYAIPVRVVEDALLYGSESLAECSQQEHDDEILFPAGTNHVPAGNMDNALTCGFAVHTPEGYPGERTTPLLTKPSRPGSELEALVDWSDSKDEIDTWADPNDPKSVGPRKPSMLVADLFYESWQASREKRPGLAYPWSTKKTFLTRIKKLLEDESLDEVLEMVRVFFRQIDSGKIKPKQDDLWKDFWYLQGNLRKIARRTTTPSLGEQGIEASNRRLLERP